MGYGTESFSSPTDVLRSLADPTRRSIFEHLLREGEQNVRTLTDRAGISQAAVSKHLNVLKQAGLVSDRPEGRKVQYTAEPQGLDPLIDWIGFYSAFWRDRFDHLEGLLDRMDP
ncbi:MAG: sdpR 2 [Deinococcus sp.]|nr:sdpR 2 [Deinococcus sp.]